MSVFDSRAFMNDQVKNRRIIAQLFTFGACFKALMWKLVSFSHQKWTKICMYWIKLISIWKWRLCTRTRFETEAKDNSEMGYWLLEVKFALRLEYEFAGEEEFLNRFVEPKITTPPEQSKYQKHHFHRH